MTSIKKIAFAVLLLGLMGTVACGGDDDDSSGGGAAAIASCKQVCTKTSGAKCALDLGVELCNQICDAHAQAPAACQNALKAVSDCQLAQADICSAAGCDQQETAYQQACTTK
jgi:hypothetical protein